VVAGRSVNADVVVSPFRVPQPDLILLRPVQASYVTLRDDRTRSARSHSQVSVACPMSNSLTTWMVRCLLISITPPPQH